MLGHWLVWLLTLLSVCFQSQNRCLFINKMPTTASQYCCWGDRLKLVLVYLCTYFTEPRYFRLFFLSFGILCIIQATLNISLRLNGKYVCTVCMQVIHMFQSNLFHNLLKVIAKSEFLFSYVSVLQQGISPLQLQQNSIKGPKSSEGGARLWAKEAWSVQQITREIQRLDQRKKPSSRPKLCSYQHAN